METEKKGENGTLKKASIVYFSHGGGPLPILGDASHAKMVRFMEQLPQRLKRPEAIIVFSAHWEESEATILGAENPEMFYDYYGFPEEAYAIEYPAPGSPELAAKLAQLLEKSGVTSRIDNERGFDHGLFIPLHLMYPDASIPAVQISLLKGLDPAAHIGLGKALQDLLGENVLITGSGFSFHNMQAFSWSPEEITDAENDSFQDWLVDSITGDIAAEERERLLHGWEQAPAARYCHPREEHLLPLFVCQGLAGMENSGEKIFDDYILGKRGVAFKW